MKLVTLLLEDGRRLGIPRNCVQLIASYRATDAHPNARAIVRFLRPNSQEVVSVYVRDGFKRLLRLFPKARADVEWVDARDTDGLDLVFPQGSILEFEEQEGEDGFLVLLEIDGAMITLALAMTHQELVDLTGGPDELEAEDGDDKLEIVLEDPPDAKS